MFAKNELLTMLRMQDRINARIHENWIARRFEWYRAVWVECGELIEHYGYKWWKKQEPDLAQVQLEVVDIWHFGMSALFREGSSPEDIADAIRAELSGHEPGGAGVREATEALALHSLRTKSFSAARFRDLMIAADLDFDSLYQRYVGKNVLNFFRQDNGYREGAYIKRWAGREDNEHLVEIVDRLDSADARFADTLYAELERRYAECRDLG